MFYYRARGPVMGEAWVSIGSVNNAARLSVTRVDGASGVGVRQLRFHIEAICCDEEAARRALWFGGTLSADSLGTSSGYIGRLFVEQSPISLFSVGSTQTFTLVVDLNQQQLEVIEEHRTAGLHFRFYMDGTTMLEGELERIGVGSFEHEVSQSDWIKVLEQMQYRRTLLLELETPDIARTPELAQALTFYRAAEKHYLQREWRNTTESLRQCCNALVGRPADEEDTEADAKAAASDLRKATKIAAVGYRQRAEQVRRALKFMCDLGAHPEVVDTHKPDAAAALIMVGGLLQAWR
ncbi:hypothetical protein AB0910_21725 [Streptomyces sp. NPDC047002]|uniref:hypothetical protein n=1 Tax=Streptomyces sp. NPDC047002 TaxID=3155475 RepID=UPI003454AF19